LAGRHANFWQVTGDALDFALDSLKLANPKVREELMDLYLRLSAYPEVKNVLAQLEARGFKCAILSNGSPNMLRSAIENAGIQSLLDAVLSVEDVQVYKPHPGVSWRSSG
jgi:2-haloacid dehalogenase